MPYRSVAPDNNPLWRQAVLIFTQNPQGSFATRRLRQMVIRQAVQFFRERFCLQNLRDLEPRHVLALVGEWKASDRGRGWIQHKLAYLRWLLDKLGKSSFLPSRNKPLGIAAYPKNTRQGKILDDRWLNEVLLRIGEPRVQVLILLARYYGLRFKEASLLRPNRDVDSNLLRIKRGSKGGRPRFIRIVGEERKRPLRDAQSLVHARDGCLVPESWTYIQWRRWVYPQLQWTGMFKDQGVVFHDLRRTFAARELGRLIASGRSPEEAAKIVSKELGHNRIDILRAYMSWPPAAGSVPRLPAAQTA